MTGDQTTQTVGELRKLLQDRHGTALAQTDKLLADVTVAAARTEVADRMRRAAKRVARHTLQLDPDAPRFDTDPDDPLDEIRRDLGELVELFGCVEQLAGRGAKRVRKG